MRLRLFPIKMEQVFLQTIVPICLHTLNPRVRVTFRCLSKKVRDYIDKHYARSTIVLAPNDALSVALPLEHITMEVIRQQRIRWTAILAAPFHLKTQLIYIRTMPYTYGMTFILGNIFSILRDAGCGVSIRANCARNERTIHEKYGPDMHYADGIGKGKVILLDNTCIMYISNWLSSGAHVIAGDIPDAVDRDWVIKNATIIV